MSDQPIPIVKVYSTKWCTDCMLAKQFLREHSIPYEDISLEMNVEAREYVIGKMGRTAKAPILEINGKLLCGNPFDREALAHELGMDAG